MKKNKKGKIEFEELVIILSILAVTALVIAVVYPKFFDWAPNLKDMILNLLGLDSNYIKSFEVTKLTGSTILVKWQFSRLVETDQPDFCTITFLPAPTDEELDPLPEPHKDIEDQILCNDNKRDREVTLDTFGDYTITLSVQEDEGSEPETESYFISFRDGMDEESFEDFVDLNVEYILGELFTGGKSVIEFPDYNLHENLAIFGFNKGSVQWDCTSHPQTIEPPPGCEGKTCICLCDASHTTYEKFCQDTRLCFNYSTQPSVVNQFVSESSGINMENWEDVIFQRGLPISPGGPYSLALFGMQWCAGPSFQWSQKPRRLKIEKVVNIPPGGTTINLPTKIKITSIPGTSCCVVTQRGGTTECYHEELEDKCAGNWNNEGKSCYGITECQDQIFQVKTGLGNSVLLTTDFTDSSGKVDMVENTVYLEKLVGGQLRSVDIQELEENIIDQRSNSNGAEILFELDDPFTQYRFWLRVVDTDGEEHWIKRDHRIADAFEPEGFNDFIRLNKEFIQPLIKGELSGEPTFEEYSLDQDFLVIGFNKGDTEVSYGTTRHTIKQPDKCTGKTCLCSCNIKAATAIESVCEDAVCYDLEAEGEKVDCILGAAQLNDIERLIASDPEILQLGEPIPAGRVGAGHSYFAIFGYSEMYFWNSPHGKLTLEEVYVGGSRCIKISVPRTETCCVQYGTDYCLENIQESVCDSVGVWYNSPCSEIQCTVPTQEPEEITPEEALERYEGFFTDEKQITMFVKFEDSYAEEMVAQGTERVTFRYKEVGGSYTIAGQKSLAVGLNKIQLNMPKAVDYIIEMIVRDGSGIDHDWEDVVDFGNDRLGCCVYDDGTQVTCTEKRVTECALPTCTPSQTCANVAYGTMYEGVTVYACYDISGCPP